MSFHRLERAALADALEAVGPDAPTLCEGWRSRHLAAHVVLRERAPVLAAGAVLPPLAARTERAVQDVGDRAAAPERWQRLLDRVRRGPGRWHPLEVLGDVAQLVELHVHTEDVRRGGRDGRDVAARPRSEEHTEALWRQLTRAAGPLYRRGELADVAVTLVDGTGRRRTVGRVGRSPEVVVRGEVGELVLHAFGRSTACRVTLEGDDEARRRMVSARPSDEPG